MNETIQILKKVILRLCSYIFFSVVLFIVSYCLMTKEFPPNLTNMRRGFENLSKIKETISQFQSIQAKLANSVDTNNNSNLTASDINTNSDFMTNTKNDSTLFKVQFEALEITNKRLFERVEKLEVEVIKLKQQQTK